MFKLENLLTKYTNQISKVTPYFVRDKESVRILSCSQFSIQREFCNLEIYDMVKKVQVYIFSLPTIYI